MADPQPSGSDSTAASQVNNTATGNARVDAQIGTVEGDAVFHKHETIYQVADGDTPEKKFQVARNLIDGGIPRLAEDLIRQAMNSGLTTTKVAYYYAISVLSDRSVNQLGPKELDKCDSAIRIAWQLPPDEWRSAVVVIGQLVRCMLKPDDTADRQSGAFQIALDGFHGLTQARQAEISRHLDMILNGAIQDQLDWVKAKTVAAERAKGDRADRAWKFFHPDPAEPRRAHPTSLRGRAVAWVNALLGVAGLGPCLVWGVETLPMGPLIPLLIGGIVAVRSGTHVLTSRIRRQMKEYELTRFVEELEQSYLDNNSSLRFVEAVRKRVNYRFGKHRPAVDRKTWDAKTAELKATLHARLVRLYAARRVDLSTLDWLVRWHAKQAAKRWKAGKLTDFRRTLRPEMSVIMVLCGGTVVSSAGVGWLMAESIPAGLVSMVISAALVISWSIGLFGVTYLFGHRRAVASEDQELDALFNDERREFERWRQRLSDRPTDSEMANWLEYDKAYIKTAAMRRCNISNRDIVAHVVLTSGKRGAKRARVIHGPPRFSKYVVLVFLLTENGVREMEVDLNFLTGAIYDERRSSFRYDALASAKVLEEGFQAAEGRHHIVRMGQDLHLTDKPALVICRTFQLSLVNDQTIEVVVDNYEGLLDETVTEERSELDSMALDSSGVGVALQVLEAVAAEGREWIARERDRRNRRWEDWEQSLWERSAITGRPWPLGIGPAQQ